MVGIIAAGIVMQSGDNFLSSFLRHPQNVTSSEEMDTGVLSTTLRVQPFPPLPVKSVEITRMTMKKLNKR